LHKTRLREADSTIGLFGVYFIKKFYLRGEAGAVMSFQRSWSKNKGVSSTPLVGRISSCPWCDAIKHTINDIVIKPQGIIT
jgi:hypothetical protein